VPPTSANVEKYYQQGYRSFLFADYEKAVLMYGGYLKNKPDDDFVWYSLAESYLRLGQIQKAVEAYEKAIALNPSKALYHKGLAVAYNYLDQNHKVIDCAEKARKLGKDDSILNTLLGKSLINQQNFTEAVQVLEKALEQNCNNLLAKFQLAIAYMKTGQVDLAVNHLQEISRSPVKTPIKMEAQALLNKLQRTA
ncbi:MAG: tetratricopeptide repeat protein, partial [Calditrichaeota bacterium]